MSSGSCPRSTLVRPPDASLSRGSVPDELFTAHFGKTTRFGLAGERGNAILY